MMSSSFLSRERLEWTDGNTHRLEINNETLSEKKKERGERIDYLYEDCKVNSVEWTHARRADLNETSIQDNEDEFRR